MLGTNSKAAKNPLQLELRSRPVASIGSASPASLKGLLGERVTVGAALGTSPAKLTAGERALVLDQLSALSPENCMKPGPIHPRENEFFFDDADEFVAFANQHDLEMTGHCLAWHQQYPLWFFKDGEQSASRELVLARLRNHIQTVMSRYRGKIKGWDVVNEAVSDHGNTMLRQTPWTETVGDDFVEQAFRIAHEADPGAELYYNDFNIELPRKRARTLTLLRQLLDAGVHIDGVGIQGHWIIDQIPFAELEKAINLYHSLGLKVLITELDLDIMERPDCGADVSWQQQAQIEFDPYQNGCPDEVIAAHAQQYAQLFELFYAQREKLSRITFWGLHDGASWLNQWPWKRKNYALLFDREARCKFAFKEVVNRLAPESSRLSANA